MNRQSKIVYILFYTFALLVLIVTGHVKIKNFGNWWKECIDIIRKHKPTEDKDWMIYKHDK